MTKARQALGLALLLTACGDAQGPNTDAGASRQDAGEGKDAGHSGSEDGGSADRDASRPACEPKECENQPVPAIACADGPTQITCSRAEDGTCHAGVSCGARCGGIAGGSCEDGLFCNYETQAGGDGCEVADGQGLCTARPQVCPELYAPVCGCDGRSYGSVCEAHAAGVSVGHSGLCSAQECKQVGGRAEYGDGASLPSCRPGEDSFPILGRDPALCCLAGEPGFLRWYQTCGDPVCHGHTDAGVSACTTQRAGQACANEGSECDPGDACNARLRCTTSDPTQALGGCPL